jgi:chromosome segregation ATPase
MMKPRGQMAAGDGFDGFDKNVAEKMPRIRKEEAPPIPSSEEKPPSLLNEGTEQAVPEIRPPEKGSVPEFRSAEMEKEENLNVLRLIEDLHGQLLVSNRTKRALEMDLTTSQKTIHQLTNQNRDLESRIDGMNGEIQRLQQNRAESIYLEEENEDALEKIRELQEELNLLREKLADVTRERDEALARVRGLESQMEQNEFLRIKERLKEREASHFSEEGRQLQSRLKEALAENMELEKRYEALRKSFNEVKQSLTLLRDSCKTGYYNLSETPE